MLESVNLGEGIYFDRSPSSFSASVKHLGHPPRAPV